MHTSTNIDIARECLYNWFHDTIIIIDAEHLFCEKNIEILND